MSVTAPVQLGVAIALFIAAASSGKTWAVSPSVLKLVTTLLLYTGGNLLIRQLGMATAFSMSAVLAVALVTLGPRLSH